MQAEWERGTRDREAVTDAQAAIDVCNSRLAARKEIWAWPIIGAALATKHHWLVIACDACGTIVDLDLTMKRRDPNAPIYVALKDALCPRCNGDGRPRVVTLARFPS